MNAIDTFVATLSLQEQMELADAFLDMLSLETNGIILEGYPLTVPAIRTRLQQRLEKAGAHVWTLSKNTL